MTSLNGIDVTGRTLMAGMWRGDPRCPRLRTSWEGLIAGQNGSCTIYQSPAFFEYLAATEGLRNLDLLILQDRSLELIAGVIPTQRLSIEIPFSIGDRTLFKVRAPCLRVLGSEPMIPRTKEAHDELFALIANEYRDMQLVEMDKVCVDGFLWQYLLTSSLIRQKYFLHVLHGVRDCHLVHLPSSIDEYRRQLGRKRRYNLERQHRLLERHLMAPLTLTLLNREEHVPIIIDAMKALGVPDGNDPTAKRRIAAASRHGFQYCFVLQSGDRFVGMTFGTKSMKTYRIHKFFYDKSLAKYSPGTTMWYRVLRFLIEDATFQNVDMGYGTPVYSHRRTNAIRKAGKILLFRRTLANRCIVNSLAAFSATVNFLKLRVAGRHRSYRAPERRKLAMPRG